MIFSRPLSLQKRLIAIIFSVIGVPLLVAALLLLRYQDASARAHLLRSLHLTERMTAQLLQRRTDMARLETRRFLARLSDGRTVHRDSLSNARQILERVMESSRLDGAALLDARGRILAEVLAPGARAGEVPWESLARLRDEQERIRGAFGARALHLAHVVPLIGAEDALRYRLVGVTSLAPWNLDELRTLTGVEISLLEGRERKMTTRFDRFGQTRVGGKVALEELALRRESSGAASAISSDSARRLRALSDLFGRGGEALPGAVLVEIDDGGEGPAAASDLWVVWTLIPFSLLLALVAGVLISRMLVSPVRELRASVQKFAAVPERARPVTMRAPGEVGDLVRAFNAMVADIQDAFEKIKRIHFSARKIAATFDAPSLAELAAHEMRRTLGAEAGFLWENSGGRFLLAASAGAQSLHVAPELPESVLALLSEGGQSAKGRYFVLSRDHGRELFGGLVGISQRVLLIPLRREGASVGLMLFLWKDRAVPGERELYLGEALAASLLIQVRNIAYLHEIREKAQMDAELLAAKAVQEQLLPRPVNLPGVRLASRYVAAQQTGGDWFGYYYNSKRHCLDLLVADVTGHGFASALLAGVFCGAVYAAEEMLVEIGDHTGGESDRLRLIARLLNKVILQTAQQSKTVTMALLTLRLDTGEVVFLNGGHNAPLWLMTAERKVRGLVSTGSRLGYAHEPFFDVMQVRLKPGDGLFLYTDGLIENRGPQGALPSRRVRTLLAEAGDVVRAHEAIWHEAEQLWGNVPAADDVTTLALTWEGPVEHGAWTGKCVPGGAAQEGQMACP